MNKYFAVFLCTIFSLTVFTMDQNNDPPKRPSWSGGRKLELGEKPPTIFVGRRSNQLPNPEEQEELLSVLKEGICLLKNTAFESESESELESSNDLQALLSLAHQQIMGKHTVVLYKDTKLNRDGAQQLADMSYKYAPIIQSFYLTRLADFDKIFPPFNKVLKNYINLKKLELRAGISIDPDEMRKLAHSLLQLKQLKNIIIHMPLANNYSAVILVPVFRKKSLETVNLNLVLNESALMLFALALNENLPAKFSLECNLPEKAKEVFQNILGEQLKGKNFSINESQISDPTPKWRK